MLKTLLIVLTQDNQNYKLLFPVYRDIIQGVKMDKDHKYLYKSILHVYDKILAEYVTTDDRNLSKTQLRLKLLYLERVIAYEHSYKYIDNAIIQEVKRGNYNKYAIAVKICKLFPKDLVPTRAILAICAKYTWFRF